MIKLLIIVIYFIVRLKYSNAYVWVLGVSFLTLFLMAFSVLARGFDSATFFGSYLYLFSALLLAEAFVRTKS